MTFVSLDSRLGYNQEEEEDMATCQPLCQCRWKQMGGQNGGQRARERVWECECVVRLADHGSRHAALCRFRANVAHIRQSRPGSGLGFKANVLKIIQVVPFLQIMEADRQQQAACAILVQSFWRAILVRPPTRVEFDAQRLWYHSA